jgi:hypothetical protein
MKEDFAVFTQWYQTLDWIVATAERLPKHARFSFATRMVNLGLDTMELVIQAIYTKERVHILDHINLLLEKQRVMFRLACDRRYLSIGQHEHIARALNDTGRMIGGWRRSILEKSRASAGTGDLF